MSSSEIDLGMAVLDRETSRLGDRNGNELELRHQSRLVLSVLARSPGETVTREALIEEVWSGRAVAADSVAQCIAEIRRVLQDTDKRIVETVPRAGYRLIVPECPDRAASTRPGTVWVAIVAAVCVLSGLVFFALRSGSPAAPVEPPVIAVLPFEDFSTAAHRGFLSDAVAEGIITMLARYPQMTVISRRSSFQFRNADIGALEIAARLGADFILEGSQQFDGEQVRITAQLIDGRTNKHIWADEIDGPLDHLLKTNTDISGKIANAVGFNLIDITSAKSTAGDVSALMIANAAQSRIMRNFTRENLLINLREQDEAIRKYPESAWGYLGQALALRNGLRHGWIIDDRAAERARMEQYARHAVALDPNNYMAYHALGRVLMFNREVEAAISAFRRGAELNPSSSLVGIGLADGLVFVGETDAALELIATMERIDPLYGFSLIWTKSWALWQAGRCQTALETYLSHPSMPVASYKVLAAIHICLGNTEKARSAMTMYLEKNPDWTLARVREDESGMWTAPGMLEKWLIAMEAAGMPH